jgi:hypothetical protein
MFLSEVLQTPIGKVDAELMKGIGPARHGLGPGISKRPMNVSKSSWQSDGLESQFEQFEAISVVITDTVGASASASVLIEISVLGLVGEVIVGELEDMGRDSSGALCSACPDSLWHIFGESSRCLKRHTCED